MAVTDYRTLLYDGTEAWKAARTAEPAARPDLTGISLSKFADDPDLGFYDLSHVLLRDASISKLSLSYASLVGADCRGTQFSALSMIGCDLTDADFRYSRLYNCSLASANLTGTNFTGALLSNVDVAGAIVSGTNLGNIDLSRVLNLDKLAHHGPVVVGALGLRESLGRVPRTFLEKAGVHEDILRVVMPWAQQPIRYHKCFISYASEDSEVVVQLRDQLVNNGVDRTFVATRSLKPGDRYPEVIRNEIASSGRVIVVVSRHAIRSEWVAPGSPDGLRGRSPRRSRHSDPSDSDLSGRMGTHKCAVGQPVARVGSRSQLLADSARCAAAGVQPAAERPSR